MPVWQLPRYLGGPVGFTGVPFYTSLFWVWLLAILTLIVAFRIKESTHGRAFLSIREDEIAAEAMGIKTTKFKVRAFVIAAFFAGIAGGLYAHTIGVQLNAGELAFMKSFDIIIMVVLGGMGSISGAAIAAAILSILPELLRKPPSIAHPGMAVVIVGALVLVVLFTERKVRGVVVLLLAAGLYEGIRQAAAWKGINLADYRMILYALALITMMIMRPQGLFGVRELWNAWHVRPLKGRGSRGPAR
jgi:ABC-type branched-subunit amino acid transport system permease subunit